MLEPRRIEASELENALGLPLDRHTRKLFEESSLAYEPIDAAGQLALWQEIGREIDRGFTLVGEQRAGIWGDAWRDRLDTFIKGGFRLDDLNPSFVGRTTILRWQGAYIQGITERFELAFFNIFRDWLFRTYLPEAAHLHEFGSGSAFNVAAYARLYPDTEITALDWAPAAVEIANLLRVHHQMRITGRRFDFFAPDVAYPIAEGSFVLTMCALEQIGSRFAPFLEYLLSKGPRRVVHVEPMLELYDPDEPHDQLAIRYHTQRGYLAGYLPALQRLEKEGKIRILLTRRVGFGSRFHECYSIVVWEPC